MPKGEAIGQMSLVRGDVSARMRDAIDAILDLCWDYRSPDFSFSDHIALQREVNRILAQLSDGILSDTEKRAVLAIAEEELQDYEDEALEYAEGEINGEDVLFRLDRQGDHLKDLIAGWLVVAAILGLSKGKVKSRFWTFLGNVGASPDWRKAGIKIPKWGRGFQADIERGMTVIGQNVIFNAYQRAQYLDAISKGAVYFIRHRGSSYDCPECDSYCEYPIPISQIVYQTHSRCVCWNEYFNEKGEKVK